MRDQSLADVVGTTQTVPQHIAIIMDGNNRWARARDIRGKEGHAAGQQSLETIIRHCAKRGVQVLTVFAFSSENWRRSAEEVSALMNLFATAIEQKADDLHSEGVQIRFVGDLDGFSPELQEKMRTVMQKTQGNSAAILQVCVNYGGQWDVCNAARSLAEQVERGSLKSADITTELMQQYVVGGDLPMPDLCIRTGDEFRISNFLLWQLAYAELFFSEKLWPDFSVDDLDLAIDEFASRQRRFGRSGDDELVQNQ